VAVPAIIALGLTGAIALAAFVKAGTTVFLGASRSKATAHAHEAGPWMRAPMIVTALVAVILGLAPLLVWPAIVRVAAAWHDGLALPTALSDPLHPLALLLPMLAVVIIVGIGVVMARSRRLPIARQPTWDCGYNQPTAHMQYTGGSFGGIIAGWFRWVLQPALDLRRPRGAFPATALRLERTPDTVLELGLGSFARGVLAFSTLVRRLQHGRLQYYIAYVVAGLIGLAALAVTGGTR
jgi:hydrogenase-4 component B